MVETATSFSDFLATHFEWLAVFDDGRAAALRTDEVEVSETPAKTTLGMHVDEGFLYWRVLRFAVENGEAELEISRNFGSDRRNLRLIPRTPAAELALEVRTARLIRANQIAAVVAEAFPSLKIARVSLNEPDGRLARIIASGRGASAGDTAIIADVTKTVRPESIMASALKWLEELNRRRKKPVERMWIAAEPRQMSGVRRLHTMLSAKARACVTLIELRPAGAVAHEDWPISALWRRKPKTLSIPSGVFASKTAAAISAIDPERIDVIRAKNGETIRFNGLPFARVRNLLGKERTWFGVGRQTRELHAEGMQDLHSLLGELTDIRRAGSHAMLHRLYRASSEHWLESILKRDIQALDGNLILSPIYNQFRFSADKIDLLAIRRDGRLVVIEVKTSPDRDMVFQAADYWQKIELQRRAGVLAKARLFGDIEIRNEPALVYTVAPALSFHHDFEFFAAKLHPDIELWRFELHEDWRREIKVIGRVRINGQA